MNPGSGMRRQPCAFFRRDAEMAFAVRDLSVLAYANGFTLWHYKAGEAPLARVESAGFFNDVADMMAPGDMMMVSAPDGARLLYITPVEGELVTAPMA